MAPMTPAAWLQVLELRLVQQQREIQIFEDYYDGRHKMAFMTATFRQSFGNMFKALADNWCPSVVDAAVDRLVIWGFLFGNEEEADQEAWDIWQANNLDAESIIAHTEAGKDGKAFLMVAPPPKDSGFPLITVEHASQMVVALNPANRRERLAALKKWRNEDGYDYATLYLPTRIYKFRSKEKNIPWQMGDPTRNWVSRPGDEGGANSLGVVPVVPLVNKPLLLSGGKSDLDTAIPLQDAINKEVADMLVASEFAAFPQRVLMGVEVPTDSDGMPTAAVQLKAAINRFWALEEKDARIGEFSAADLGNYVKAITLLLQHMSAQTRTPPHYLLGEIVNVSGDALVAAETGLTKRVERKQIGFGDAWEEVMRLAFRLRGKAERARDLGAETIWKPAEMRAEAQVWDSAVKMRSVGLPLEAIWAYAGLSPKQIKRYKRLAGLPDRPPPGATTAQVPPVLTNTPTT